ncbi:MAG: membrane protein insertase YidC, partial [Nitrospiria bacterium]
MEKRAVLFLIISLLIVLLYPYFLEKFGLIQEPKPQKAIQKKEVKTKTLEAPAITEEITETLMPPAEEKLITVETELYRAILSTRGAAITQWKLKNYTEGDYPLVEPIQLYRPLSEGVPPLSIMTGERERDEQLQQAIYQLQGDDLSLDAEQPTGTILFILDDPARQRYIAKSLTFHHDSYRVDIELDVRGKQASYEAHLGTNFGIVDWGNQQV